MGDNLATSGDAGRQRLDKWLWFARVVKTRTLAAKLVSEGHVRLNSARMDQPAHAVRPGDVLTIALDRQVRVLKVRSPGARRGPYGEAQLLFEDLTPPPQADRLVEPPVAERPSGEGRPTKKHRRALDKWRQNDA